MRLAERLGVDERPRVQAYYGCLLATSDAPPTPRSLRGLFGEGMLLEHFNPVMFGSPREL